MLGRSSSDKAYFPKVDMITDTKFSNHTNVLKLEWFGSKIYILSIKVSFKATYHLQSRESVVFPTPTFILASLGWVSIKLLD